MSEAINAALAILAASLILWAVEPARAEVRNSGAAGAADTRRPPQARADLRGPLASEHGDVKIAERPARAELGVATRGPSRCSSILR
jgi:hypothetical protein